MITMQLSEARAATDATLHGADARFVGVSTDTRTLNRGELFCALSGPNFDGHDYCDVAMERGAAAALLERPLPVDLPALVVEDTQRALGLLARAWRQRFSIPVIGITGSNGKTTVKQMVAAILGVRHSVLATEGNLNNEIGVPQTLFRLDAGHGYAVVEMGASHVGDIAALCDIAKPDVGVITLCAPAHLEGFGTLEKVAETKGEIYAGLEKDGVAIINADDRFAAHWSEVAASRRIIRFGFGAHADVRAGELLAREPGFGTRFTLYIADRSVEVELPFDGRHNVANALAAAAAAHALDIPVVDIKTGLERAQQVGGRLNVLGGLSGARVIDDTYNANPASLRAALSVLASATGEKWVVLGDMGELGTDALQMHEQLGREARELGIDRLFTIGELAAAAARGFGEGAQVYDDVTTLCNALVPMLHEHVTVLVKGSRFMRMERVSQALTGAPEAC